MRLKIVTTLLLALIWFWVQSLWNSPSQPILNDARLDYVLAFSPFWFILGLFLAKSLPIITLYQQGRLSKPYHFIFFGALATIGTFLLSDSFNSYSCFFAGLAAITLSAAFFIFHWAILAHALPPLEVLILCSVGWALSSLFFLPLHLLSETTTISVLTMTPIVIAGIIVYQALSKEKPREARMEALTTPPLRHYLASLFSISICSYSLGIVWTSLSGLASAEPWTISSFLNCFLLILFGRSIIKKLTFRGALNINLLLIVVGLLIAFIFPDHFILSGIVVWLGTNLLRCICFSVLGKAKGAEIDNALSFGSITLSLRLYGFHLLFLSLGTMSGYLLDQVNTERIVALIALIVFFGALFANNLPLFSKNKSSTNNQKTLDSVLEEACVRVSKSYSLTKRESEVLILLSKGYSSGKIAEKQVVSVNTIKTQVRNIYAKLEVRSKQELLDVVFYGQDRLLK